MAVFGGRAFERGLGHEGGALMNGISVLIKDIPCEDTVKRQPSMSQEAGPHQTLNLLTLRSWASQPPEL